MDDGLEDRVEVAVVHGVGETCSDGLSGWREGERERSRVES